MSKEIKNSVKYNGVIFLVIGLLFTAAFLIWVPYAVYSIIRWIIETILRGIDSLKWRVLT